MKCKKCNAEWQVDASRSASITVCPFCQKKIEAEKSGDWKYFDNTKDLLAFIAAEYGLDALFSKKYLSDHASPMLPPGQKKLVSETFSCGAVKILQDNMTTDQQHKEIAVKQAVKKLTDLMFSQESAERVVWEFTNAIGWGIPEPKNSSSVSQLTQQPQSIKPQQTQNIIMPDTSGKSNNPSGYPSVGSIIKFANIDWRVLNVENNKALIISEKIIENRPYNVGNYDITWENCTLRKYLNNVFYNSLGATKYAIAETRSGNPNNPWYGTAGGSTVSVLRTPTTDKVFLLSLDEVCRYFGDSTANLSKKGSYYIDDQNNSARIANYGNEGASWWWLRSPGRNSRLATYVLNDGAVNVVGFDVYIGSGGVRPALWLNL